MSNPESGTSDDPVAARQPRRAAVFLRRTALGLAAVVILGFGSSLITRRPSELATRRDLLTRYQAALPTAPQLQWVNPSPLVITPWRESFAGDPIPSRSPIRDWIFAPKYAYTPQDRRLIDASKERPYIANGYVVTRMPLPFVVRTHYGWALKMWDQQTGAKLGLRHGDFDVGVVTYLAFFGVPIEINHYAWYGSTP